MQLPTTKTTICNPVRGIFGTFSLYNTLHSFNLSTIIELICVKIVLHFSQYSMFPLQYIVRGIICITNWKVKLSIYRRDYDGNIIF